MSDLNEQLSSPGFYYYEELTSTNSQLRELMQEHALEEMSVVMAGYQQSGRGQVGNSWESEREKNLLMSVLLYPRFVEIQHQFGISMTVSLAVADTLLSLGIEDVKVKWPNDIYIGDKKVAGILIEHSIMGPTISESIVGIGLNVNQVQFVSNAPNPTSMSQAAGKTFRLTDVFEMLMDHLVSRYEQLMDEDGEALTAEYHALMWRKDGKLHHFKDGDGEFEARIAGVDEIGRLVLNVSASDIRVYGFKEVEYVK